MATRPPFFDQRFTVTNAQGALVPAALHLLYTFESGTTTLKQTFSDAAGLVPNANPIELNAEGRCTMYLGSGAYTLALHDPDDAPVDGAQWDNVTGVPAPTADQFVPLAGGVTMTGLFTLSGNATANLNPVTLQQANSLIAASAASVTAALGGQLPLGAILLWPLGTPPDNWIILNGVARSRTAYPALFGLWGTTFGTGDGTSTFGVPDFSGRVPRGLDTSAAVDPDGADRALGSTQEDAMQNLTGTFGVDDRMLNSPPSGVFAVATGSPDTGSEGGGSGRIVNFDASRQARTATENRMKNIAMHFIAKAA